MQDYATESNTHPENLFHYLKISMMIRKKKGKKGCNRKILVEFVCIQPQTPYRSLIYITDSLTSLQSQLSGRVTSPYTLDTCRFKSYGWHIRQDHPVS